MVKQYIVLFLMLVACNQTFAQKNRFPCEVSVPYNIGIKELLAYGSDSDAILRGDSCRTYNILHPERKSLGDGVYRFFYQGKKFCRPDFSSVIIPKPISLRIRVVPVPMVFFQNILIILIN